MQDVSTLPLDRAVPAATLSRRPLTVDYGLFSPWCRMNDIADVRALDMRIDLRRPHLTGGHLFYGWNEGLERLRSATARLAL